LHVGSVKVRIAMLFEKLSDTRGDFRETILGHGREEMVFNLEIEVCHPPVYESVMTDVHRMFRGVRDPIDVLIFLNDWKMSVRNCKIGENVSGTNPDVKEVAQNSHSPSKVVVAKVANGGISAANPEGFKPFFLANDAPWVKEGCPADGDEEAGNGKPKHGLILNHDLRQSVARFLGGLFAEGD